MKPYQLFETVAIADNLFIRSIHSKIVDGVVAKRPQERTHITFPVMSLL